MNIKMKKLKNALDTMEGKKFKIAYADGLNAFELLVFQLISTTRKAFADAGLTNYKMAHAALAHQTADPLTNTWYSTFYCLIETDQELTAHLTTIRNFVRELTKERNVLAHTAFWGHSDVDIANTGLTVFLLRHGAKGAKSVEQNVRTNDLIAFRSRCDTAAHAVLVFSVAAVDADWKNNLNIAVRRMRESKKEE
jgi:hypothetical protein